MEVATVFLETSLGTCLAVSFPASTTTVADLKRRVSYEHAAAFPFIGQIAVQAIKVSRGGTLFHLTDSMPVRDAFLGAAVPWTLKVDALVGSAFGCHKRSLCESLTAQAQLEATHTETEREKHRVIKRPAAEIVCVLNEQCSIDDEVHIGATSKQETHLLAPCVEQELKQGDQPSEKQVEDKEPLAANVCDGDLVPPPCAAEPTKEAFLLLRMDEDRCSSSRRGPHKRPTANPSVQSSPGAVPPMCYSLLKDLTDRSPSCRIRTRIARLWEHRMGRENILVMLHMVLVDEEGQSIHAFVRQEWIPMFAEQLKQGWVYYFQNFETKQVKAAKTWRCANHSCEVRFTKWTKVNPILPEPDDFPPYAYRLRSFKDILDTVEDKTYLADVVGLVTGISDLMTFKHTQKRIVRLYDGSDHAIIHLWGGFPDDVDADELIRRSESEPVILLAMGFMFDKEYSMLSLRTAYGCRICINPASDVSAFRNRIIGTDHLIKRIDDKGQLVVENTSVINLVSEVSSSGAGHTDSRVDVVSAGDLVAEPTVSATTSDMKRKTRSTSKGGDNPRGLIEVKKKKIDNDPNRAWFKTTWRKAEEKWSQMMAAVKGNLMTPKRWSLGMTTSRR